MGAGRIKFTDGSYISVAGTLEPVTTYNTYVSGNAVIAAKINDQIYTMWNGDKTDLDGNIWNLSSAGVLTITKNSTVLYNKRVSSGSNCFLIIVTKPTKPNDVIGFMEAYTVNNIFYNDEPAFINSIATSPRSSVGYVATINRNVFAYYTGSTAAIPYGGAYFYKNPFTKSYQPDPTDPYAPGGESDLAGGEGDFDGTSDPIDFPNLPTLSAVDTGLISLFNPSVAEIKALATYMWGPPFDMENWKKLFANPMDALLGLSIVPVHVPDGGQDTVKVGNIDTNISMNKAGSQYTEVDCGSLNVNEYWGAYLDYEPYTHVQIYLPYIGVKEISTDDVMGKAVHIKYHVDILSGSCVAYVKCGASVLYSFSGQCAASIPITGRDYTGVVQSAISLVSSAMGVVAMGAAAGSLGTAAGLAKSAGAAARLSAASTRMGLGAGSGVANMASDAINITKPVIQKSANISSAAGLLGIQVPYMILTRPRQCLPANQNRYIGYPSMITSPLSSCSGFTRVEAIHLENIGATEEEIAEIEEILHAGVIF
jgi:hypothetical protein